jgi:hypothetical protein
MVDATSLVNLEDEGRFSNTSINLYQNIGHYVQETLISQLTTAEPWEK